MKDASQRPGRGNPLRTFWRSKPPRASSARAGSFGKRSRGDLAQAEIDEEGADGCETYYFNQDGDAFGVEVASKCLCAATARCA